VRYTAQRHRIAALETALGRPNQVLRIIGGLPEPATEPVPPAPKEPDPEPLPMGSLPNTE
jgi:hypothetical protein